MNSDLDTLLHEWRQLGWNISTTSGGRLRLTHPRVSQVIHTGTNPTENRSIKNLESLVRRAMRVAGLLDEKPQQVAAPERRKLKKKIKPQRAIAFSITPLEASATTEPQGLSALAQIAERVKQQQRLELVRGWQLYCLRMLSGSHPDPWTAINKAKHILRCEKDAQDRVIKSLRAAPTNEIHQLRQSFRENARERVSKRLAVSALIERFRSSTPHTPYGAIRQPAALESVQQVVPVSPSAIPAPYREPDWPEHVRAWRYAALKMRLGGALWSAIRANHRRTDKLFRQRVLDTYRAADLAEMKVLRQRLRVGEGRDKELARRPAQIDITRPSRADVQQPMRQATQSDVTPAVRAFGASQGITYIPRKPAHDCSVCANRSACWRVKAGLDASRCRSFTEVRAASSDPRLSPQLQAMLARAKVRKSTERVGHD